MMAIEREVAGAGAYAPVDASYTALRRCAGCGKEVVEDANPATKPVCRECGRPRVRTPGIPY